MGTPTLMVVWREPTATDNSEIEPERMQTHLPGESFPVGTTNVMYLFWDEAGNQAICDFDVTGNNLCLRMLQLIFFSVDRISETSIFEVVPCE